MKSSVFDRDSLRAMPLGLGLHYASMTEREREQIARRYASAQTMSASRPAAGTSSVGATATDAFDSGKEDIEHDANARPPPSRPGCDSGNPGGAPVGSDDNDHHTIAEQPVARSDEVVCVSRQEYFDDSQHTRDHLPPPPARAFPLRSSSTSSPMPCPGSPTAVTGGRRLLGGEAPPYSPPPALEHLHHISLSQVDRDVLDCLPHDVRDEVLRAIVSNSGASSSSSGMPGARRGPQDSSAGYVDLSEQRREGEDKPGLGERTDHVVDESERSGKGVDEPGLSERRVDQSERGDGGIAEYGGATADEEGQAEPGFVDLRSPAAPTLPQLSQDEEGGEVASEPAVRKKGTRVFEVESAEVLRGVLRGWIGGAVASPSQWHLELIYRYESMLLGSSGEGI